MKKCKNFESIKYKLLNKYDDIDNKIKIFDFDYLLLCSKYYTNYRFPELDERTGMTLSYTSGTSGDPKGILYSHRSIYLYILVQCLDDSYGLSSKHCLLTFIPFYHALGWSLPYGALFCAMKVLFGGMYSNNYYEMIKMSINENCSIFAGVPTIYQNIKHVLINTNDQLLLKNFSKSMKKMIVGGSKPSRDIIIYFYEKWNIEVVQIWGMAEVHLGFVGKRIARRSDLDIIINKELYDNQDCAGIIVPTQEAKIVDLNDLNVEITESNKIGQLLICGPYTINHYYKMNKNKNNKKFTILNGNKYLITGDIALFNDKYQLILKDRSKDMIKSGGEWISSVDLENCVMELNEIDKACCIPIKHPKWDQRPIIIVTLNKIYIHMIENKDNRNVIKENIIKHLKLKSFEKYSFPDDILFWDNIPLQSTGKIDKKFIKKKLNDQKYILPSLRVKSKL